MIREYHRVRPGDIVRYLPLDSERLGTVLQVNENATTSHGMGYGRHWVSTRKLLVRWTRPHRDREWVSWVIDRNCEIVESPMVRLKADRFQEIVLRVEPMAEDETNIPYVEVPMLRPDDEARPLRYWDV